MQANPGITRGWILRHPQALKSRDAVLSFQCVSRGLVQVTETVPGESTPLRTFQSNPDVIAELEKKYIFFANEADIARKLITRGSSCTLGVYFREP
jgi:hypothetical protein